ncbi:MAG: type 1 glutamine amidotransferase domain-containing protein [Pseudomonadota bacterium]
MAKIIIPIPSLDFDPTEVAVPWKVLSELGHEVSFATPDGHPGQADEIMITGEGLDLWGLIPGLKKLPLIGRLLRANSDGLSAYRAMIETEAFRKPLQWDSLREGDFDGLLLPGGHRARGIQAYLESPLLQQHVVKFFSADKPIGAICHGALIPARSINPATGRSVLFGRKTTALTWNFERSAAKLGKIIRFWDPFYYRTYREAAGEPVGYMSVEHEIIRSLEKPSDFLDVPPTDPAFRRKTSGLARDTMSDQSASFVVTDGNYVSARWPGDAHRFALQFAELLRGK